MKSFFDAIILITCFTALFLSYYLLKRWLASYRKKRTDKYYSNIIINKHQAQNRRKLQAALAKMKSDQLFWAEIYIHSDCNERFRLEHKPDSDEWLFLFDKKDPGKILKSEIEKYGCSIYTEDVLTGIRCFDSESLLNCLVYFFEKVVLVKDSSKLIIKY